MFEPLPPIAEGACGALFPLRLSRLPGGIPIAPEATLTCDAAEALSLWVRDSVVPEAEKSLGHRPGKLLGGTSYECRGRNRDPGAQLSEHAFANGLDLSGFSFARRPALPIAGQKAGSPEDVFQAAIRASACNFFTTVLGPGVEAHADHLHLDTKRRSKGYRLCQ